MKLIWCVVLLGGCLAGPCGCMNIKKALNLPSAKSSTPIAGDSAEQVTDNLAPRKRSENAIPTPITKLLPSEVNSENASQKAEELRQELTREMRSSDRMKGMATRE